jgi:hypothetical protein
MRAGPYYLRRLTGTGRPEHRSDCSFSREQATLRQPSAIAYDTVVAHPEGYFSLLTPEVEKLAQMPEGNMADSRARRAVTPRLARLLWRLMERAHVNTVPPVGNDRNGNEPSIQAEFDALKRGARGLEVAPGIELTRVLFYYAGAYHSEQIFAKLCSLARNWPEDHAPQAFMLLYTALVHGHDLDVQGFAPIHVANRVQCLPFKGRPVSGPFLSLVVIGDHPETHGYTAVRAYAQSIFSGRRFMPVGSDTDRDLLERLFTLRNQLMRGSVEAQIIAFTQSALGLMEGVLSPCPAQFGRSGGQSFPPLYSRNGGSIYTQVKHVRQPHTPAWQNLKCSRRTKRRADPGASCRTSDYFCGQ